MALRTYRQKRKFDETPEPPGSKNAGSKSGLKYCIQKHSASHLHYDLRLEADGVLKSWAVPKGPSLNPKERRLAMMVEDHPIDYQTFEGHIPAGNYGAGEVIVWDIGTYRAAGSSDKKKSEEQVLKGLKNGHIKFVLNGKKLKGAFALIKLKDSKYGEKRGRNSSWLLVKDKDEHASARDITLDQSSALSKRKLGEGNRNESRGIEPLNSEGNGSDAKKIIQSAKKRPIFRNVKPMLSTLVAEPFDDPDWLFEIKWDGYRAIAEVEKGNPSKVRLYSRNGLSLNDDYPDIVEALKKLPKSAVLDGEVVAFDNKARPSFQLLQDLGMTEARLAYAVFDILHLDGRDLTGLSLEKRKIILKDLLTKAADNRLIYSDYVIGKGKELFESAEKLKLEGIMGKRRDSHYLMGYRSREWLKMKTESRQEAVICGFTEARGSRQLFGALILGIYKNGELTYIGHTGGGFNGRTLETVYKKMRPLITGKCPFKTAPKTNAPATWVKPELICEVKFENWTAGGHMRQPIFVGLREDKATREASIEKAHSAKETVKKAEKDKKAGAELKFTNLDKILWPEKGYKKGDLIDYYGKISDTILPYLKDRPQNLNRHPDGIHGFNFYEKNFKEKLPEFGSTVPIKRHNGDTVNYLICNNRETLLFMANLGCIEINPWSSRVGTLDRPDFMVIDLDPGGNPFEDIIKTAQIAKKVLDKAGLISFIKTSGKRGLHIAVPMGAQYSYDEVRLFSEIIGREINEILPELTSIERSPGKRKNKIYLDYLRNGEGQTAASVYSLRPNEPAGVSTPLRWSEVKKGLDPKKFNIKTIFARLKKRGDLWAGILEEKSDIKAALKRLGK